MNVLRTEFGLCLAFKNRLYNSYCYSSNKTLTYIGSVVVFFKKVPDRFYKGFAESLVMGSSLGGILPVYETEDLFTIVIIMGNRYFNILAFEMNDGVTIFISIGFACEKIQ